MEHARVRVFVYLLNEGVDVWAPAMAEYLGGNRYRLLAPDDYNPDAEVWQFLPGEVVLCEPKTLSDGQTELVAVRRAG